MKKFIKNLFVTILIVYLVVGAFATLCLLKKNDKGVTVIGNTSLVIMDNNVDEYYKKGDLVFIAKPDLKTVQVGEPILFYDTSFNKNVVTLSNVTKNVYVNENESTFTVKNNENKDKSFSGEYLIGRVNGSAKLPLIGSLIKVMTTRWGFLFLVILPFLLVFLWEAYTIIKEVKKAIKESREE